MLKIGDKVTFIDGTGLVGAHKEYLGNVGVVIALVKRWVIVKFDQLGYDEDGLLTVVGIVNDYVKVVD